MRLMVYSHDCANTNWTKMDLMDCHVSNCDGKSILWQLPPVSGAGPIKSALTGHCLTVDDESKVSTQPCHGAAATANGGTGQSWKVQPAPDSLAGGLLSSADTGGQVIITDTDTGRCFAETAPADTTPATVWVGVVGARTFVALFNTGESAASVEVHMSELGLASNPRDLYFARDVWVPTDPIKQVGGTAVLAAMVAAHGVVLYEIAATAEPAGPLPGLNAEG
jgi:hypothetical protein